MTTKKKTTEDLRCDAITATPIDVDWIERLGEDADGWMSWEAQTCEDCKAVVVVPRGGETRHDFALEAEGKEPGECQGELGEAEGPMMNYAYPLPGKHTDADAAKLAGLPVCLVEMDGGWFLALTGGGMDLSWEICEAYIALGYLPPRHFVSNLPRMGGDTFKSRRAVLEAGRRSIEVQQRWLENDLRGLDTVALELKRNDRRRAAEQKEAR